MITDLVIEDYQALAKANLRLRGFTVVTGPTGSGKSAVIRALKLVTFNQRGTSFIRHGAKSCKAAVGIEGEGVVVGIQRGKGADAYRIARPPADPAAKPDGQTLTKLGGAVPDEVTAVLRLSDVNFAGQHDPLFLLTASGGEVARRLGELTNVTLLLNAAREANRRRLEVSRELQATKSQLASLVEQATRFRDLKEQRSAMTGAEAGLATMQLLEARKHRLAALVAEDSQAQRDLAAARALVPDVPSVERLTTLAASRSRLAARLAALTDLGAVATRAAWEIEAAKTVELDRRAALAASLRDAGYCPTCRQPVDGFKQLAVTLYGDGRDRNQ